jgi:glycosyltransferase involved in cell wall biosynthesis
MHSTEDKKKPSCTLIIATYNWPQALSLCLHSVLQQSLQPSEIIIADDGSGLETKTVVTEFQQKSSVPIIHVWHADEGFRLGTIRNKAVAAAKADYIIQIDGDLILHKDFIADHLLASRKGFFLCGSRVILNQIITQKLIQGQKETITLFSKDIKNRFNILHANWLRKWISKFKEETGWFNLRGCNMSFWRSDFIAVNGYNEAINGWGREDSEIVIRFYNAGVRRSFFKFSGIVFHLYHPENDRSDLQKNDLILASTLQNKIKYCTLGVVQHLKEK